MPEKLRMRMRCQLREALALTRRATFALLALAAAPVVAEPPPGVGAATARATEWIDSRASEWVGELVPVAPAGPDAYASWFEATGGGTMQRFLGLRLGQLWTSGSTRDMLRLAVTVAVLIAAARLLWRRSVEGQPVVPTLASLLLKLLLGYLLVYHPAWVYGLARSLQATLLTITLASWTEGPGEGPAAALAERLAIQRGVLEAVAARQPVMLEDEAAGGGEAGLAAHEAWLAERGLVRGPASPVPEGDAEAAGRRRAERLREVAWAHGRWRGPPGERLTLPAGGGFAGVSGARPLGERLEKAHAAWREEAKEEGMEAGPGGVGEDYGARLTALRRAARAETLAFLDETLLRPVHQWTLLDGVLDALETWARYTAARLGRTVIGETRWRDVAEGMAEAAGGMVPVALGALAAVGSQLMLELAVGGLLLAFPLSFVPGWEGMLGWAARALLRPVLWLPVYVLGAGAVDGALARWTTTLVEPDLEPNTWGEVALGWALPMLSPLLVVGVIAGYLVLQLVVLVLVTWWSGRWLGNTTGVARWVGGWLTAGVAGLLRRTGIFGGGVGAAAGVAGGGAPGRPPVPDRWPPAAAGTHQGVVPWRVARDEAVARPAAAGNPVGSLAHPSTAASGFRRRWVAVTAQSRKGG